VTDKNINIENESQFSIPDVLTDDLRAIYRPPAPVPPEVDRAVTDRARRHFVGREFAPAASPSRGRPAARSRIRWAWRIAAAAAVIIFAFSLDLTKRRGPSTDSSYFAGARAVDIDQNGRVDILDAFKLARRIESADSYETNLSLREQGWDLNGDGLVNRNDVDVVALAAVSLSPRKQGPG
jgi:hypothetical protein